MNEKTEVKVIELLKLNKVIDPCDDAIESIADKFPEEWTNENEYVDFQQDIGDLAIEEIVSKIGIEDRENRKNMAQPEKYFYSQNDNAVYAEFSDRNPVLIWKKGNFAY